jgi:glycosyltransferase involved in cell wall biosynthesis
MTIPISVVVCTFNRLDVLRRCVDAFASINTVYEWELIIVDNNSEDGTSAFLASLPKQFGAARVTVAREQKRGVAAAKNKGINLASGDIIAFTDDDCYVAKNYIDAMISAFKGPEIGFVGGRILLYDPTDIPATISVSEDYLFLEPRTFVAAGLIQGANMAFRRTTLDRVGGFDENLGAGTHFPCEDIDIIAASLWAGTAGAYDPGPLVYHHHGRKTKREEMELWRSYDKARGAYFAKYILRADTRSIYIANWIRTIRRGAVDGGLKRFWHARRSWREFCGGLHYIAKHVM